MAQVIVDPKSFEEVRDTQRTFPREAIELRSRALDRAICERRTRQVKPAGAKRRINFAETKSDIQALLLPGLKTVFGEVYQSCPAFWTDITTVVPSTKDTEQYGWLGATPGMNQFIDERRVADMATYSYAIQNKTWESTIAVDRTAVEDDLTGQLALRVRQMAEAAKTHLDSIVFSLLASGFSTACYDGANFFGTHTSGAPGATFTQSNKLTAEALTGAAIQDGITLMQRFLDDSGRPMGITPDTLVVPPELQWEAWTLMNSTFHADPVSDSNQNLGANPLRGTLKVTSVPYLTDTDDWFLVDTRRVVKAIILQMRKEFEFDALEVNSETGFLRDKFYYGVRARYNVGFGEWRCAVGASNS